MKLIYHGESSPLYFMDGQEYECRDIQAGMYIVYDETGEDYMYYDDMFTIKEGQFKPTEIRKELLELIANEIGISVEDILAAKDEQLNQIYEIVVGLMCDETEKNGNSHLAKEYAEIIGFEEEKDDEE